MINLLTQNVRVVAKRSLEWTWHGIPRQVNEGHLGIVTNPSSQTVNRGEVLVKWDHLPFGDESVVRACDVTIVH
jgi:hypothetical protein